MEEVGEAYIVKKMGRCTSAKCAIGCNPFGLGEI